MPQITVKLNKHVAETPYKVKSGETDQLPLLTANTKYGQRC